MQFFVKLLYDWPEAIILVFKPIWLALGWRPVLLGSDLLVFLLVAGVIWWVWSSSKREHYRIAYRQVARQRTAMVSLGILLLYATVGLLDSMHYRTYRLPEPVAAAADAEATGAEEAAAEQAAPEAADPAATVKPVEGPIHSVLDRLTWSLRHQKIETEDGAVKWKERREKTYSSPLATKSFAKETIWNDDGTQTRDYKRLQFAGTHLEDPESAAGDIALRSVIGLLVGLAIGGAFFGIAYAVRARERKRRQNGQGEGVSVGKGWAYGIAAFLAVVVVLISLTVALGSGYHLMGTDKTGQDVLYMAIKSIRTGLIIGTLTTIIVTPFAVIAGLLAGYFGGRVDDVIQYIYTTLASIPSILLIVAALLIFRAGMAHEEVIITADKRLLYICLVLGITSWTGLCRMLRAEVLKLREQEYVQAAVAFGASPLRIMMRHLAPNVMHIVLISTVLNFSGLVLAEAVLAYIGVGVDGSMASWGNMIQQSLHELARDPIVWWNLAAAFVFMFVLVLAANLFGDSLRDALDPRLRTQ